MPRRRRIALHRMWSRLSRLWLRTLRARKKRKVPRRPQFGMSTAASDFASFPSCIFGSIILFWLMTVTFGSQNPFFLTIGDCCLYVNTGWLLKRGVWSKVFDKRCHKYVIKATKLLTYLKTIVKRCPFWLWQKWIPILVYLNGAHVIYIQGVLPQ